MRTIYPKLATPCVVLLLLTACNDKRTEPPAGLQKIGFATEHVETPAAKGEFLTIDEFYGPPGAAFGNIVRGRYVVRGHYSIQGDRLENPRVTFTFEAGHLTTNSEASFVREIRGQSGSFELSKDIYSLVPSNTPVVHLGGRVRVYDYVRLLSPGEAPDKSAK